MSKPETGVSSAAYNKLAALRRPFGEMETEEQADFVKAVRERRRPMTKAERAALAEQKD